MGHGPARVLLGSYGSASNALAGLQANSEIVNRRRGHDGAGATSPRRATPSSGSPSHRASCLPPDELRRGDLAAFEPSNQAVEFEALSDTEFVLGSAVPHGHDLVLGYYSVHTSQDALRDAEAHISSIKKGTPEEMDFLAR
jgi:hypothetical protein